MQVSSDVNNGSKLKDSILPGVKTSGSQNVLPFLIMTITVPKILLKKLIGYQEKVLLYLKKHHEVTFYYDEKLVNDFVYALDETTIFQVFGKGSDVVRVCAFL